MCCWETPQHRSPASEEEFKESLCQSGKLMSQRGKIQRCITIRSLGSAGPKPTHQDLASLFQHKAIAWIQYQSHAVHKAHVSTAALLEVSKQIKACVCQQKVVAPILHNIELTAEVNDGGTGQGADRSRGSTYKHKNTWDFFLTCGSLDNFTFLNRCVSGVPCSAMRAHR